MGAEPADVGLVVRTRLHYDHMQNDTLLPTATVAVQAAELNWAVDAAAVPFYLGIAEWKQQTLPSSDPLLTALVLCKLLGPGGHDVLRADGHPGQGQPGGRPQRVDDGRGSRQGGELPDTVQPVG